MNKIRKGDKVRVVAGKSKGTEGIVLSVVSKKVTRGQHGNLPKLDMFVLVEGANIVTKHVKPNPRTEKPGEIRTQEALIHCSNVMLINGKTGQIERVGIRTLEDGQRVRFFKRSGDLVDA